MLTQSLIANLLLRAKSYRADVVRALAVQEYGGDLNVRWVTSYILTHMIEALSFALFAGDYATASTISVYDHLYRCVGNRYATGVSTDPTAQPPGGNIIIINNPTTALQSVQSDRLVFTGQTEVDNLLNYQASYASRFGNNPFVSIWTLNVGGIGFTEDTGTVPTITYVNNDPAQGVQSIIWTYPIPTSGYIQILGIKPQ